jgi:pimeloyl-ACP methyl ester carboxylesterase
MALELRVESYGRPDAPPIILTNGWGANSTEWDYLKKELADDFRLIVWDYLALHGPPVLLLQRLFVGLRTACQSSRTPTPKGRRRHTFKAVECVECELETWP